MDATRRRTILGMTALGAWGLVGGASAGQRTGTGTAGSTPRRRLHFDAPATQWLQALPVGNGRIGGMVHGGVLAERIALNHIELWSGRPADDDRPEALTALAEVRALLFAGRYAEANALAQARMMVPMDPSTYGSYQMLGDLLLNVDHAAPVGRYERALDMAAGVVTVAYDADGHRHTRTVLASFPAGVLAVRLTTSAPGGLTFSVRLRRAQDAVTARGDDGLVVLQGRPSPCGTAFAAVMACTAEGGRVDALDDDGLAVSSATAATVLIGAATDLFHPDPHERARAAVLAARRRPWSALLAAHTADHRGLFDKVRLDLASPAPAGPAALAAVRAGGPEQALIAAYFDFGRYLLIASSRPGSLPANLQGLWADGFAPPWSADYHININLQMNYWPAEVCGLHTLHEPLFAHAKRLLGPGARTARIAYGCDGSVAHYTSNPWGHTALDGQLQWGMWPHGLAWLSLHFWEHHRYAGDDRFLRERALPCLAACATFTLDHLVPHPVTGKLVAGPATSPENSYRLPDGRTGEITMGPAMSQSICRAVLGACRDAAAALQAPTQAQQALAARCSDAIDRLQGLQIGSDGRVMEWPEPFAETEPGHRHVSHLFGLYPGEEIDPVTTPQLADAARKTLAARLVGGGGQTGWSAAWLTMYRARLGEGDAARAMLLKLLRESTADNWMDTHPSGGAEPLFQIDGNFGATAAIVEMLLQSHGGRLRILPALPAAWPKGRIAGVRARGGLQVAIVWSDGAAQRVRLRASLDVRYVLVPPPGQRLARVIEDGKVIAAHSVLALRKGSVVDLRFAPAADIRAHRLTIDHRAAPAGLRSPRPRFGWHLAGATAVAAASAATSAATSAAAPAPAALSTAASADATADATATATAAVAKAAAVSGSARGLVQTAARVVVHGPDGRPCFDSGRVPTTEMALDPRTDLALPPQTPLTWSVMVWDRAGRASPWSDAAPLVTGADDVWRGVWIAAERDGAITAPPSEAAMPATSTYVLPLLRRRFRLDRPVRHAVVCLSGLGAHALSVNGRTPSTAVMNPGWTDYRKTVLYETIDVGRHLRIGDNVLGVRLGSGMYDVQRAPGRYTKFVGSFGAPKLILQLRIVHDDGSERWIVSDGEWQSRPGPMDFSSVYGGEDDDARREPAGWDTPRAANAADLDRADDAPREPLGAAGHSVDHADDERGWSPVYLAAGPGGLLRPQTTPGLVVTETLAAVTVSTPAPGITVHDFGRNTAARPRLTLRGAAGATVVATPGELLGADGRVTQASMGAKPDAAIVYRHTLGGADPATAAATSNRVWTPAFSHTGFRYLETRGDAEVVTAGADVLRADLPTVSSFESDVPRLDAIHALIRAAVLSNVATVITDCPHREKLGWLEQTWLNAGTVLRTVDALPLYAKLTDDLLDAQRADGMVPSIAPEYIRFVDAAGADTPFRHSPEWGSAIVQAPWAAYRHSGDASLIVRAYPAMCRYAAFLETQATAGVLDIGLGDWYDLGPQPPGEAQLTSRAYTGTAVWYDDLCVLAAIARVLGRIDDAARHTARAAQLKDTINRRWFDPATGRYDRGSQTAQAMALALDLPPAASRQAVLGGLLGDIGERRDHVSAGDIGFHYVVRALGRAAPERLAALLLAPDAPSYGAQLDRGATALTEAWDANPTSSQNHFMLGHAMDWLHAVLGGIDLDFVRGAASALRLAPCPIAGVGRVAVTLRCTLGDVASAWQRVGDRVRWQAVVPAGATAVVALPGAAERSVGSGTHDFEWSAPAESPRSSRR